MSKKRGRPVSAVGVARRDPNQMRTQWKVMTDKVALVERMIAIHKAKVEGQSK